MGEPSFKYDVAFSFLASDEQLARGLHDAVSGRLKSFIYSERQLDLVGKDGIDAFSEVFAEDARVVVVLYRPQWGETRWTRIEANAIKARCMDQGYDFLLMIPLDSSRAVPKWYPLPRIWFDLERFGVTAGAAVIEDRVRKAGGTPHELTAEEIVEQLATDKVAEDERLRAYVFEGPQWAKEEIGSLFGRLQQVAGSSDGEFRFERDEKRGFLLLGKGYFLGIDWRVRHHTTNTLDESRLLMGLQEGTDTFKAHVHIKHPRLIRHRQFRFHVTKEKERRWVEDPGGEQFTTERLAIESVKVLVEEIRRGRGY